MKKLLVFSLLLLSFLLAACSSTATAPQNVEPFVISAIPDQDPDSAGIQLLPLPGKTKYIPITVAVGSEMTVTLTGEFNGQEIVFSNGTGVLQLGYATGSGNYDLVLTAETSAARVEHVVSIEVLPLIAFHLDSGFIQFGNTTPGSTVILSGDTDTTTQAVSLQNLGNTPLHFGVYGTHLQSADNLVDISQLSIQFGESFLELDENNQIVEVGLLPGEIIPLDLTIMVPEDVGTGVYAGTITLVGVEG